MADANGIRVWDPLVMIFHWLLVIAFFSAYATGEDVRQVHEWMGYLVLGLVVFRIVWGFVGPVNARFRDFVRGPAEVLRNLKDIALMHPRRYLGHSPAGGAMVVLLLAMLAATTATGIVADEPHEQAGPGMTVTTPSGERGAQGKEIQDDDSPIAEAHEVLANVTLALVLLHIAGVIVASFAHRENLLSAMFTGRKRV